MNIRDIPLKLYWEFQKLGEWNIAIRKRKGVPLIDGGFAGIFVPIENNLSYWYADPILFEYKNHIWLFVEAYNRKREKGEIGVFEVVNGIPCNFASVIKEPFHMSYPMVFTYNDKIYMIPETGESGKTYIYECVSFPHKWERITDILTGNHRDSTVWIVSDRVYLFTHLRTDNKLFFHKYLMQSYELDMCNWETRFISAEEDTRCINRPAGPTSRLNDYCVMISQNSKYFYGQSVYVWQCIVDCGVIKHRNLVEEISGREIYINGKKPASIHTYSEAGGFEVIDFREKKHWYG